MLEGSRCKAVAAVVWIVLMLGMVMLFCSEQETISTQITQHLGSTNGRMRDTFDGQNPT